MVLPDFTTPATKRQVDRHKLEASQVYIETMSKVTKHSGSSL